MLISYPPLRAPVASLALGFGLSARQAPSRRRAPPPHSRLSPTCKQSSLPVMFTPDSISDLSMMTREDNNELGAVIGGHVHSRSARGTATAAGGVAGSPKGEISRLKLLTPSTGRLRCGARLRQDRIHTSRASLLGTSCWGIIKMKVLR